MMRIPVFTSQGEHAYYCSEDEARGMLRSGAAHLSRRRDGRVRALHLSDTRAEPHNSKAQMGQAQMGHWRTSHHWETRDNPAGVWTHDATLLRGRG